MFRCTWKMVFFQTSKVKLVAETLLDKDDNIITVGIEGIKDKNFNLILLNVNAGNKAFLSSGSSIHTR